MNKEKEMDYYNGEGLVKSVHCGLLFNSPDADTHNKIVMGVKEAVEKAAQLDKLQALAEKYKAVIVGKDAVNYEDEEGTVEIVCESIFEALKAIPDEAVKVVAS